MSHTTCRARWIVPVDSPPIENGSIVFDRDRIVSVRRAGPAEKADVDFGDAAVVPGFVNAHTHLELTRLHGRIPYRGSFLGWIADLVAGSRPVPPDFDRMAAIRDGLRHSLAAGVTSVGDVGLGVHALTAWREATPRIVGWLEVLGMGPRRLSPHEQALDRLVAACESCPPTDRLTVGLSPHAPYSADTDVYERALEYAQASRRPICTHLAETREETQFLADGTGPFRGLLELWGLWDGSFTPPRCSPVTYAHRLGLLDAGALLVHVNYASNDDLDLLARSRAHVAYCPRSHRFFDHPPHRWLDMLARGVNVCVGTDSLASNDSLSVLDELRFLHRRYPAIPANDLLRLGTVAGARALALDAICGSLAENKAADFAVFPLTCPHPRSPVEDILSSDANPIAVYCRGTPLHPRKE